MFYDMNRGAIESVWPNAFPLECSGVTKCCPRLTKTIQMKWEVNYD